MTSPSDPTRARALLDLAGPMVAAARRRRRSVEIIEEALGPRVAAWAYASNREKGPVDAALARWPEEPLLVLCGTTGCGKTTAAARVIGERGGMILRADASDRWSYSGREAGRFALSAPLLVDELGMERRPREEASGHLHSLLTSRADAGAPTILVSNLTIEDLEVRYSAQFWSRYGAHAHDVTTEDMRPGSPAPDTSRSDAVIRFAGIADRLDQIVDRVLHGPRADAVIREAEAAILDLDRMRPTPKIKADDFAAAYAAAENAARETDRLFGDWLAAHAADREAV